MPEAAQDRQRLNHFIMPPEDVAFINQERCWRAAFAVERRKPNDRTAAYIPASLRGRQPEINRCRPLTQRPQADAAGRDHIAAHGVAHPTRRGFDVAAHVFQLGFVSPRNLLRRVFTSKSPPAIMRSTAFFSLAGSCVRTARTFGSDGICFGLSAFAASLLKASVSKISDLTVPAHADRDALMKCF